MIYRVEDLFLHIRNGMSIKQASDAGGLPITRIETIANAEINLDRVGFAGVNEELAKHFLLEEGEILFSHINSVSHIGKCALYKKEYGRLVHGMNLLSFKPNEKIIYPKFALYSLRSQQFRDQLAKSIKKAVNQASVSIGDIKKITLRIPPLAEQQRIAAILDKAAEIKAKREQAIAKLDQLAQRMFVEMFGDPITNPLKWPISKLGDVGELDRGVSKHRPRNAKELMGNQWPLIQTGDVANCDGYIYKHTYGYSDFGLKQSKLWPVGTLCITIAANIAKTGILTFEACFPDSIVGFKAPDQATVQYVRVWLSFLQKTLEDTAPESAQKNINLAILRGLNIPVPPIDLQIKFSSLIEKSQTIKSSKLQDLHKIQKLTKSLQYQAFTTGFNA